jgi:hypothetical protein
MSEIRDCQIPCLPRFSQGYADLEPQPLVKRLKRALARPWNYHVKKRLKQIDRAFNEQSFKNKHQDQNRTDAQRVEAKLSLQAGDWVRVRSREEIEATLDRWKELKGCAFLEYMWQYCDTRQQVLQPMERFLDERDYKVKKVKGLVLLKDVICRGTPVFGRCDRCCHLFWRVEWLEKIDAP